MLKIFWNKKEKDLVNFWNHMVFHPTDAIEDDWGRQHLDKLAEDRAVQMVRMYAMFEESVTQGENGGLQYDFSMNDYRIDSLLSRGMTPYIVYAFYPGFLGVRTDQEIADERYKGKLLYSSYLADYAPWEEICRAYTQHLVDRYGEEQVASWYIHCYNEPDLDYFFYKDAPSWQRRAEEYCKLYAGFEKGVTAASSKLKIGGPSLDARFDFLEYFLNFVRENKLRLDFISYHTYGYSNCLEFRETV